MWGDAMLLSFNENEGLFYFYIALILKYIEWIIWNCWIKSNIAIFVGVVASTWHDINSPIAENTEMISSENGEEPSFIIIKIYCGKTFQK